MRMMSRAAVLSLIAAAGLGLTALPAAATTVSTAVGGQTASSPGASANAPLWTTKLSTDDSAGTKVTVSPDGSAVFAIGEATAHHTTHGLLVAYNSTTGALLWQSTETDDGSYYSITVSPDSSTVYVTGEGHPAGTTTPLALTVAYDASTGAILWTQAVGKVGRGAQGNSITVAPDGSAVYVTGHQTCVKPAANCYLTVAYNATTGASLWTEEVSNDGDAQSIAVAPDGSAVYVTGGASPNGRAHSEYSTVAYNAATGATIWTADYAPAVNAYATSVAVSGSTVFVTGYALPTESTRSERTVAYAASSGTQTWEQPLSVNPLGLSGSLAVSPDGATVYLSADIGMGPNNGSYATVAYGAATGTQLWKAIYTGHGGTPSGLAVSPDGSTVYVTGNGASAPSTGHPSEPQYTTLAYNAATGAEVWVRHFGDAAAGSSFGFSVAVSPDSSTVYVTGRNNDDFTTLAYGA